eukprot:Amastigsp_a342168_111.p1 type:complete len:414 gc:universal Amastigsp_a342168_111:1317-76(-)
MGSPCGFAWALPLLALVACVARLTFAQNVEVFVAANPPFITSSLDESGNVLLVGYEIDLIKELFTSLKAVDASRSYTVRLVPFSEIFERTSADANAIAVASITMTAARERRFGRFSVPYFNSGLDVLTRQTSASTNLFLFFAPFSVWLWISIIVSLYFSGHVIWFLERNYQPVHFPRTYLRGVNEGVWYCWGILTGTCSKDLIGFPSRMYSVGWSILAVVFVAAYTANLATILTVQQLDAGLTSYQQLGGKRVAAVAGSTGELFVLTNLPNADLRSFTVPEDAFSALILGQVDAFLHDSPTLVYLKASRDIKNELILLGQSLTKDDYGILMNDAHPMANEINEVLLELGANGIEDAIYRKWFNYAVLEETATLIASNPRALSFFAISGMYITLAVSLVVSLLTFAAFKIRRWC